jgi:ribonucleoside-diphosphate reductase alpha chain
MASLALRSGVQAEEIVKQMRGISCHLPVGFGAGKVTSCADAMAKAMEWYLNYKRNMHRTLSVDDAGTGSDAVRASSTKSLGAAAEAKDASVLTLSESGGADPGEGLVAKLGFSYDPEVFQRGACPDCGGTVEHADGCVVCRGCGYTECG